MTDENFDHKLNVPLRKAIPNLNQLKTKELDRIWEERLLV